MPTIRTNDCEMHYELDDYTDPWARDVETVWLQHGVGRSSKFWYHWVPSLARHYRVIRRDMRGHGESGDPGSQHVWSIDELIDDMRLFLDGLGLERMHYVGESIGGILGVAFAARWPERFKSLTLCSTPTAIRPSAQKALAGAHQNVSAALGKVGAGGWVKVLIDSGVIGGLNPAHIDWVVGEWSKTPTHVLQGVNRMLAGADISPLLPQVKVPTLVLAPAHSPLTPLTDQILIRDSIPGARITVVEGHGHEIYVEDPDTCIAALLAFLRSSEHAARQLRT